MNDNMNYYDVEAMIRDARSEIRGEIDREIHHALQGLWADVRRELADVREEIRVLREQMATALISGETLG